MPPARRHLRRGQGDTDPCRALVSRGPHPQPRSSTRRPAPMPTWSAMYSCLRRLACLRLGEKSPSYFAPLKSGSSPRLSRTMQSISE